MIIDFTVENFLSFKDVQTLSFVAESLYDKHKEHLLDTPFTDIKLLKSVIIYGANASGKSNLLTALYHLKKLVLESINHKPNEKLGIFPFLLDKKNKDMPSGFELNFFCNKIQYSYKVILDNNKIHYEDLHYFPKKYKKNIFVRHLEKDGGYVYSLGDDIKPKKTYLDVTIKTPGNILFLSKAVQENNQFLKLIYDWFDNCLSSQSKLNYVLDKIENDQDYKEKCLDFIRSQDIAIIDVAVKKESLSEIIIKQHPELPSEMKEKISEDFKDRVEYDPMSIHKDADGNLVTFPFKLESQGTYKLFTLFEFLRSNEGLGSRFFCVDELSSDLNPLLIENFLKLFHHTTNNQMLCVTHDTNLLNFKHLRSDQIYFVDKDEKEASALYSLSDFKPRQDKRENWQARYLTGKYGAIPFIERMIP